MGDLVYQSEMPGYSKPCNAVVPKLMAELVTMEPKAVVLDAACKDARNLRVNITAPHATLWSQ